MQDMMQCHNQSVLERQRAHLQWQQHNQENNFFTDNLFSFQNECLGDGWPILTTNTNATTTNTTATTTTTTLSNSTSSVQVCKEKNSSSKKRKTDKQPVTVSNDDEDNMKDSGDSTKDKNNNSNKKLDYIHVRARRGQATDSHSLAERVRRERISERMKYLQALVPGCDKITGKAGMLDEIINYVQSLQRQVEFLSMKLATVNPRMDSNMEALLSKEMIFPSNSNISSVDQSLILQFNSLQQAVSVPEQFLDSYFNVHKISPGWENQSNNFYNSMEFHQGKGSSFSLHSLQGNLLPNNLKMEL